MVRHRRAQKTRDDPFAELRARGLIREPPVTGRRGPPKPIRAQGSVSDLVAEQRR